MLLCVSEGETHTGSLTLPFSPLILTPLPPSEPQMSSDMQVSGMWARSEKSALMTCWKKIF